MRPLEERNVLASTEVTAESFRMDQVSEFFAKLFQTGDFPARWHCGNWSPFLGWLYISSDAAIWVAYFIIPVVLILFIQKRPDVPFLPAFWFFGAFIVLCGITHLVDIVLFWAPAYRVSALVRFATAVVSMLTVFHLIKILPSALNLKGPQAFDEERELRIQAEKDLELLRHELELLKGQANERGTLALNAP